MNKWFEQGFEPPDSSEMTFELNYNHQTFLWETPKLCMVEDCPFGYGMCWQFDELLTMYAFDLRNTEGVHEPLLSERYRSVSSKPTYFDFITNHIITNRGANHRDGWATLYLHKYATLWRYPVKHHHVQPIQRWIAKRMIEAVIHLHAHTCTYTGMHESSRSCMQSQSVWGSGRASAGICIHV